MVVHNRRVLERKNRELRRLAAVGETVAGIVHFQKNILNGLRVGLCVADVALKADDRERLEAGWGC